MPDLPPSAAPRDPQPRTQPPAQHHALPPTLQAVRDQIDQSILRNVGMTMILAAVGGMMLAVALSLMPDQHPQIRQYRIFGGALFSVVAVLSLAINRYWSPRVAVWLFSSFTFLVGYALALLLGTGIGTSGGAIPAAIIVILGFVAGPRAGVIATRIAIGGVIMLLGAEWYGLIPGLKPVNTPPPASYAVVLIIIFMVIGSTITHFSRLFWEAMHTIENARLELQAKVDIQARTQNELLESKQRLTALLDHAPMSVLIFAPDNGHLHYANRYALHAHGAKKSGDLERQCIFTHAPYAAQDMLALVHKTRDHGAQELHWRSRHANGDEIWWAIKLDVLVLDEGQYVVCFGHDITKRLQAEQALIDHRAQLEEQVRMRTDEMMVQQHRLESVIEALPVSLTIQDRDGRYLLSNKLFEEASGLSKDLLMGCTADELFPPALAEQMREHDQALLHGTDKMVRYENSRMRRDGTRRDQLVTKVPLMDASGQAEAILTLSIDISDQKNLQRELAAAKNEAERLATVKSEFLANMSHEIRTPLHGVLGLTQIGQTLPVGDPKIGDIFDRITRSGRHLLGVINDILDFSKIDAGKLTIERSALDPRQLAEDAVALIGERASAKGLALRFQCHTAPAAVMGDALRIRQILINLLSNSVKFTEQGSVTLTLSAEHGQLYFTVKDTGIGMHPSAQERLFSPFEQADGSTSRKFGGTGLGLSISRKLAILMGGDVRLNSALGEGSTFTLVLPLQEVDGAMLPKFKHAQTQADSASRNDQARLQGLRILAADDVDINREILMGLLSQQGAQVHCADNGKQAIEQHRERGPGYFDIVLMDVQMPVMNGLQATQLLQLKEPDLPVIALTAHAMTEERQRCADAGMKDHLAKPFEVDDVVRIILKHTRRAPRAIVASETAPMAPQAVVRPSMVANITIDFEGARHRCGGRDALLRKLITRFSTEQLDFVLRCQQLLTQDPEQARRAAHMLKGTAANLGMSGLSQHAGALEEALIAQDTQAISPSLLSLGQSLNHHIVVLRNWLAEQVTA